MTFCEEVRKECNDVYFINSTHYELQFWEMTWTKQKWSLETKEVHA